MIGKYFVFVGRWEDAKLQLVGVGKFNWLVIGIKLH